MNKKISLGTVIGLIAIAVKLSYNSILKNLPERSQRYALLEELQDIIDENYYGKRGREELLASLGEGYISSLGTSDDKFMTAEEYKEYPEDRHRKILIFILVHNVSLIRPYFRYRLRVSNGFLNGSLCIA